MLLVREHIPLEQGLRLSYPARWWSFIRVREHIPLEQGLRPFAAFGAASVACGQRAYSIRTRIKTHIPLPLLVSFHSQRAYSIRTRIKTVGNNVGRSLRCCQRAYSIRTRIKTGLLHHNRSCRLCVREHIPLEQGLRRSVTRETRSVSYPSESIFH